MEYQALQKRISTPLFKELERLQFTLLPPDSKQVAKCELHLPFASSGADTMKHNQLIRIYSEFFHEVGTKVETMALDLQKGLIIDKGYIENSTRTAIRSLDPIWSGDPDYAKHIDIDWNLPSLGPNFLVLHCVYAIVKIKNPLRKANSFYLANGVSIEAWESKGPLMGEGNMLKMLSYNGVKTKGDPANWKV